MGNQAVLDRKKELRVEKMESNGQNINSNPTNQSSANAEPEETINRIVNHVTTITSTDNIPPFAGTINEDLIDWFDNYEDKTAGFGWKNEDRLAKLPNYLKDGAKSWIKAKMHLIGPGRPFDTYQKLKSEMLKVMVAGDAPNAFFRKMINNKQQKDELPASYAYRMKEMCERFDKNMDEATKLFYIREGIDSRLKGEITCMDPKQLTN